jgi:anti-sigma regulatory factor (Ser/Thr protein kinase)
MADGVVSSRSKLTFCLCDLPRFHWRGSSNPWPDQSMPPAPEQTVNVAIRNDVADLANVVETVDRVGAEAGIPARTVMQLQVVLDEVLSNIIKYAWPDGGSHEFCVGISVQDGGIEIKITDDGRPFNPLNQVPPAAPPPGRRPVPGGVGIHMVKQLVDGFEYVRFDGHNQITLTKRYGLNPPSQQGGNDGR